MSRCLWRCRARDDPSMTPLMPMPIRPFAAMITPLSAATMSSMISHMAER